MVVNFSWTTDIASSSSIRLIPTSTLCSFENLRTRETVSVLMYRYERAIICCFESRDLLIFSRWEHVTFILLCNFKRNTTSEQDNTVHARYIVAACEFACQGKVGFVSHERPYSVESSLQGISSDLLLSKQNIWLIVIQTQSWRSKPAASARASAGSKRRALAFYFPVSICYMFIISSFRGEWDLGLCMTLGLVKRMPLRSGEFWRTLRAKMFWNRKSPLRSCILFASPEVIHRPRSHSLLHVDIENI